MNIDYHCFPFSSKILYEILAKHLGKLIKDQIYLNKKQHINYLQGYLQEIGCETVLIEQPYIDRDYLEDYASYYSRCFSEYQRKCARLHFFRNSFTKEAFITVLKNKSESLNCEILQQNYLGFLVINPLPNSFIGKTCLCTFRDEGGRRSYSTTRNYEVHLLGIDLSVKSLAFQEQDSTVAACATSALWSSFHGSGILFQHAIPSPVEITRLATQYLLSEQRPFPNHALSLYQINHAIKSIDLEPYTISLRHKADILQANIYAYISAGLPALLLMKDIDGQGGHAVTVSGFSLGRKAISQPCSSFPPLRLKSSTIDKIYVHDDQTGPFARATLFDQHGEFSTYNELKGYEFEYYSLVVPLYHKIRIGYDAIHNSAFQFDFAIKRLDIFDASKYNIYWDIHLTRSIDFKRECLGSSVLTSEEKVRVLSKDLPRFIWKASAIREDMDKFIFSLVFDATDITDGCLLVFDVEYDHPYIPALKHALEKYRSSGQGGLEELELWLKQLDNH